MDNIFKTNIIDRAICSVTPKYGMERIRAKAYMNYFGNSYNGASKSRKALKGWNPKTGNSDTDDLQDLDTLVDRSYDLYRNNALSTGVINTANINVIGTGLKVQSQIDYEMLGLKQEDAEHWQRKTEREFKLWAESFDCDSTRTNNFYQLQSIAFLSALIGGDVLALLPFIERKQSPYSLAIKLLEGQHLCNKDKQQNTSNLASGIETDDNGAVKNYHILKNHPGGYDNKQEWEIIPAFGAKSDRKNVIHLFEKKRPGQKRGVPYLAPVMESLKQLGRYTEAEIMAAVVSGMFTVFIKSELGEVDNGLGVEDGSETNDEEQTDYSLGSGSVIGLAPGESIESANPNRPNPNFDPFVMAILRQIGAALQIPYELLIKHFTSSYSASRGALLEAWKFFKQRRFWMATSFCQPIYEEWLTEAVALGRIEAPGFFENPMIKKAYCKSQWNGDAPGQLDPVKETKAAKLRCEEGFSTRTKESAEINGTDFDSNINRGKSEREKMVDAKFIKEEDAKDTRRA